MPERISSGSLMLGEMCVLYPSLSTNLMVHSYTSQSQMVLADGPTELMLLYSLNYYATITPNQLKNWQTLQQDQ